MWDRCLLLCAQCGQMAAKHIVCEGGEKKDKMTKNIVAGRIEAKQNHFSHNEKRQVAFEFQTVLSSPLMYPFSLTDCSVGRFMRNFISLVRTLFWSVSPAELVECVTLCRVAEKVQTFIDARFVVPTGSKRMTSTAQPTSTFVSSASQPVVPSRLDGSHLLVRVSVLLVGRVLLILLEHRQEHKTSHR